MQPRQEEQILRGVVKRVRFRNPENGFTVLLVKTSDTRDLITVVGTAGEVSAGAHVIVRGTYEKHGKFGEQFSAQAITETAPTTAEGIERYLGSGLIKGIGPKTAKKIVEVLGTESLDAILQEPGKLSKIPGVGKHKATLIAKVFGEQQDMRNVVQFLVEHNLSPKLAQKIYQKYQNRSVEMLTRDPYILSRDMYGVGFLTADAVALKLGHALDSPQRLKAGIYYALERARDDGHCFLPEEQVIVRASALLGLGTAEDLHEHIRALAAEEFIVIDEERIYLRRLHQAESFVADFVAARCTRDTRPDAPILSLEHARSTIAQAARHLGVQFSPEQELAVQHALSEKLLIITGGPGCGKTTIIKALTSVFSHAGLAFALAAPTGRAAQRMAQVCDYEASTIHRLLKFDPIRGGFLFGANNPILVNGKKVEALIIDEASMIDILLAKDLFSAIPSDATLILVGDKDQLPSVGPGRVFGDLLQVPEIKSVALTRLFRRAEESAINLIAHQINAGIPPEIPEPDGITKTDAYFIPRQSAEEAASTIESLVADQIPRKFGIPQEDISVLTPSNKGPLGTLSLNIRLQNRLNPPEKSGERALAMNEYELRLHDRVCQRVNNYQIHDTGVFNGDTGRIYELDTHNRTLVAELWDGRLIKYSPGEIAQLSLAYALTVHRSQGSEYPCVVLALHDSQYTLLERQLLYTAVTRAKRLLIIVGSRKALDLAARRTTSRKRMTHLKEQIREKIRLETSL